MKSSPDNDFYAPPHHRGDSGPRRHNIALTLDIDRHSKHKLMVFGILILRVI